MIELRHIRYAITAADQGSFSRAALALEVDQTNLARRIATLERVLNVKLFTRSRAGVVPTIAGSSFLKEAREIVRRADALVIAMREVGQGRAGGLTLGHNSPISAGNLHATLSAWCDANPHVEMDRIEAADSHVRSSALIIRAICAQYAASLVATVAIPKLRQEKRSRRLNVVARAARISGQDQRLRWARSRHC